MSGYGGRDKVITVRIFNINVEVNRNIFNLAIEVNALLLFKYG